MTDERTMSGEPEVRYPSLAAMNEAHRELLRGRQMLGPSEEFVSKVHDFLKRGRLTGAVLDSGSEREFSQGLLGYWSNSLFRVSRDRIPEYVLVEFDPSLEPELPESMCPYRGLMAFGPTDREVFHGRNSIVELVRARVTRGDALVSLVGPSGSGKSSILQAGVLPWLQVEGGWRASPCFTPGEKPLRSLAEAVAAVTGASRPGLEDQLRKSPRSLASMLDVPQPVRTALILDQFEELFTLCPDPEEIESFLGALVHLIQTSAGKHLVLITVRSDFVWRLEPSREFHRLFVDSVINVPPMEAAELEEAITRPAEMIGLKFDEGLVGTIVREVLNEPAALPLLQFTMRKLWERRERNRLTWKEYRRLGGVREALAASAEELYDSLIPEDRETVRRIMVRLAASGVETEMTSKRASFRTLQRSGDDPDRIDRVVDRLVKARLLRIVTGDSSDEVMVQLAHEALIRNWPRCIRWLEEHQKQNLDRQRLSRAADLWHARNRDPDLILRGESLDEAQEFKDLTQIEKEYVKASRRGVRRQILRLQGLAITAVACALIAAGLAYLANSRRREADFQRQEAERQAEYARSVSGKAKEDLANFLGKEAQRASDENLPERGLLYLAEAREVAPVDRTRFLSLGMPQPRFTFGASVRLPKPVLSLAYTEDGSRLAVGGHNFVLIRASDVSAPLSLKDVPGPAFSLSFSPDGRILAVAFGLRIGLWDARTGDKLRELSQKTGSLHREFATTVLFAPDSGHLWSDGAGGLLLWDVRAVPGADPVPWGLDPPPQTPKAGEKFVRRVVPTGIRHLALSRDGKLLVRGEGATVRIIDVPTQKVIRKWDPHGATSLTALALQPDGQKLVTAGHDHSVRCWSLEEPEIEPDPNAPRGPAVHEPYEDWRVDLEFSAYSLSYSPDGLYLAVGSEDQNVRIYSPSMGTELSRLRTFTSVRTPVCFSPDGNHLSTGFEDLVVRIWNVQTKAFFDAGKEPATALAFSSDGKKLLATSEGLYLQVWDLDGGVRLWGRTISRSEGQTLTAVFCSSGRHVAYVLGGTVAVVDAATGTLVWERRMVDSILTIDSSGEGKYLAAGSETGFYLLEASDGRILKDVGLPDPVYALAFHRRLGLLAVGSGSQLHLYELGRMEEIRAPVSHAGEVVSIDFAFGEPVLASAWREADRTSVCLWNVERGAPIWCQTEDAAPSFLRFTPDPSVVASASREDFDRPRGSKWSPLQFWDAATGRVVRSLGGAAQRTQTFAFAPSGDRMALGLWDGWIEIWRSGVHDSVSKAQQSSGLMLDRKSLELTPLPPDREDSSVVLQTDPAAAKFWPLYWATGVALERSRRQAETRNEDYLRLEKPLQAWVAEHGSHPLSKLARVLTGQILERSGYWSVEIEFLNYVRSAKAAEEPPKFEEYERRIRPVDDWLAQNPELRDREFGEDPLKQTRDDLIKHCRERGRVAMTIYAYEKAVRYYSFILRFPSEPGRENDDQLQRAYALARIGSYDRAIKDLDEVVKVSSLKSRALVDRGYVYLRKGEYQAAEKDFQENLRVASLDPWGKYHLACLYSQRSATWDRSPEGEKNRKNDQSIALDNLETAINSNRIDFHHWVNDWDLYPLRGLLGYTTLKKVILKGRISTLKAAQPETSPGLAVWLDLGRANYDAANYDQAIAELNRLLNANPRHGPALEIRALARARLGQFAEAETDLLQGRTADPFNPHWALLRAFVEAIRVEKAEGTERTGALNRAFDSLEEARRMGFSDFMTVAYDGGLQPLRQDPRYAGVLRRLRSAE